MSRASDYPEWRTAIADIVAGGGLVVVTGAADTGKTTFCRCLANAALAEGRTVALVDSDTGQSEIGPPACISAAMADKPIELLSALQPRATAFVGSVTPRYGTIEHLATLFRVAASVRTWGTDLVVCDTTGYVQGLMAVRLKRAKIEALRPEHVVHLTRANRSPSGEARQGRPTVHELGVPSVIVPKPPAFRARRREARFARAFEGAVDRAYTLDDVRLDGTWLGSGRPLAPAAVHQLSRALRVGVRYGEVSVGHLGIVATSIPPRDAALATARELYGVSELSVTHAENLDNLLVGLHDSMGEFLGLGRIRAFDYVGRVLHIATPTHSHGIVRAVRFGFVRVSAAGETIAMLRPGDV